MSERAEAVAGLRAAVERLCAVEGLDGLVTDVAVVVACQRYDSDGSGQTAVVALEGAPPAPQYRVLGLLEAAAAQVRARIAGRGPG